MNEENLRPYPGALLNPKLDPVFKSMFTHNSDEAHHALTEFLSAMLNQQISDVSIDQNELPIDSEKDKQSIFDLTCKTDSGKKVMNVEMQGHNDLNSFDNRSEYHVAHLLNHFVKKGTSWKNVPEAVMISVLNFVYDEDVKDGFLVYKMRLNDGTGLKSARLKIIYLELPKFEKLPDMPLKKLTAIEKWAKFFLYANRKEKTEYVKMLAETEEGIMYAQRVLDSISQSDAEWRRERDYIDAVNTEITIRMEAKEAGMEEGRQEGLQEGLQKGLQKGIQQATVSIIYNMKAQGLSSELIASCTGLSIEEINAL